MLANNPLFITSNMSPLPKASAITLPISPRAVPIADPTLVIMFQSPLKNPRNPLNVADTSIFSFTELPNSLSFDIAFVKKPTILSTAFPNKFPSTMESRIFVNKSPNEPVAPRIPPPNPVKLPIKLKTPLPTALHASTIISITEKTPLKVLLSFSAVASLIFR